MNAYKTIRGVGSFTLIEKKSRFLGVAHPIFCEDEAKSILEAVRKEHWEASHNTYAYRLPTVERFSDDGEPHQTAGLPILNVLKGQDVQNCIIIVTRYFGGTLLGTGGLVRAYGQTAKGALDAAGIAEMVLHERIKIRVSYPIAERLTRGFFKNVNIENTEYTDEVSFTAAIPSEGVEAFLSELSIQTNATAITQSIDTDYLILNASQ